MAITELGTPYTARSTIDGSNPVVALNFFTQVAQSNATVRYSNMFWVVDDNGVFVEDITPYVVVNSSNVPTVSHDCTLDGVQTTLNFTYRRPTELQWGVTKVKVFLLVQCDGVFNGQWYRFPRGVFVVTTPSRDLQDSISREVTGYDKAYLLMSEQQDSMSWNSGTKYWEAVADCFIAAGLILTRSDFGTPLVNYSAVWANKTIPAGQFRTFSLSGSAQTYLSIINALLKDSGQQNIFSDFNGVLQITDLPTPSTDALAWTWVADKAAQGSLTQGDYRSKIVLRTNRSYAGDVYNRTNRWQFIDANLTFTPTHIDGSDGKYVLTNYTTPPSDYLTIGRFIVHTEFVATSGQADLIAQGQHFVTQELSSVETISLDSAPWCVGWHYDTFLYADSALPGSFKTRRVQVQKWTLPLTGAPMSWETNVVSYS